MSGNDKNDLLNKLKIDKNPEPETPAFTWQTYTLVGAGIIVAVLTYLLLNKQTNAIPQPKLVPIVQTQESVPAADLTQPSKKTRNQPNGTTVLNASGYVTARLMATVSAEVMGRIKSVEVEEGQEVKEGEILAQLDDAIPRVDWELLQARIRMTKANLSGLNTELAESKRILMRLESLDRSDFTSEAQVTRAQANFEKLRQQVTAKQAELDVNRLNAKKQKEVLDDHTVRAPFSGVVTVKNAQPGEIIAPSSAGGGFTRTGVCTIVDMNSLEIEVDVNEAYIGRVFENQSVVANLDAYSDWDIPASVIAVIPTADRSKATVQVRVKILLQDSRILPDMGVKVAFLDTKYNEIFNKDQ